MSKRKSRAYEVGKRLDEGLEPTYYYSVKLSILKMVSQPNGANEICLVLTTFTLHSFGLNPFMSFLIDIYSNRYCAFSFQNPTLFCLQLEIGGKVEPCISRLLNIFSSGATAFFLIVAKAHFFLILE